MLPRPMFFPLIILFICYCFCFVKAIDCGGNKITQNIVVDQRGGNGVFTTIQAAINSIKPYNTQWIKIDIYPGRYTEMVMIPPEKPCIILKGSGNKTTKISYGDSPRADRSAFTSYPNNVVISGITFVNSISFKLQGPSPAASIHGDKTAIYNCGFLGYQDTVFDAIGRHYYKNCYIQGGIDFIFGWGQSYFEDCVINATQFRSQYPGHITAQGRKSSNDPDGFVFRRGRIDGIGKVDLGRPWGPYSRVIFWDTYMSSVVLPEGWNAWDHAGYEGQLTYAEINCQGPGANKAGRVPWEKKPQDIDLRQYDLQAFINRDNWIANIPNF